MQSGQAARSLRDTKPRLIQTEKAERKLHIVSHLLHSCTFLFCRTFAAICYLVLHRHIKTNINLKQV